MSAFFVEQKFERSFRLMLIGFHIKTRKLLRNVGIVHRKIVERKRYSHDVSAYAAAVAGADRVEKIPKFVYFKSDITSARRTLHESNSVFDRYRKYHRGIPSVQRASVKI